MTVMIEKRGVPTIPDWPVIVDNIPLPILATLRHVFHDAIENDNAVFLEIYTAMMNKWDTLSPAEKAQASGEGEERFFTEEAAERKERDRHEALKVVAGVDEDEGPPEESLIKVIG